MKIKYADESRIDEVIELRIAYFREAYKEFSVDQETELRNNLREYFRVHLGRDCFIVLAVVDNKAVASAILNVLSKAPNRTIPNGKYAEIYGVFTIKEERHKGYATALIKELIDVSDRIDMSFVVLEASENGKSVYLNCGFVEIENKYTSMKYYFDDKQVL